MCQEYRHSCPYWTSSELKIGVTCLSSRKRSLQRYSTSGSVEVSFTAAYYFFVFIINVTNFKTKTVSFWRLCCLIGFVTEQCKATQWGSRVLSVVWDGTNFSLVIVISSHTVLNYDTIAWRFSELRAHAYIANEAVASTYLC